MSPWLQVLVFIGITVALLMVFSVAALAYIAGRYGVDIMKQVIEMDLDNPKALSALWALQIMGTTLPILLTPILFARYVVKNQPEYLRLNFNFPALLLLIVFSVMVMSTPVMEVLINVNQKMVLPTWLKAVEDWMRASEQAAQKATMALLKMDSWLDMVKAILLVGLATAFAEELMFRGGLQTIFMKWTKNPHVAIWITAALFSAFHMEFYGFLPRLALGVFFGYFTAWSGSIWPAVLAHFINNGTAVIMMYLFQHHKININPNDQHEFSYSLYILSIIITVALFLGYRSVALKKNDHHWY